MHLFSLHWIKQNTHSILLVLIGCILLLSMYSILDLGALIFLDTFITPDSRTYMEASDLLFKEFSPHHTRPIGYAFLLGIPNLIMEMSTRDYLVWGIMLNIASWLAMLLIGFQTFSLYFKRWVAFSMTSVFFIFWSYYGFVFLVLTETLTATGLVLITYLFAKFHKTKSVRYFLSAVAVLTLLVLVRPGFYYLAILSLIYSVIRYQGKAFRHIFFSVSVLLLIIQCSWLKLTFGDFKPSYIDSITWYLYAGAKVESELTGKTMDEVVTERNVEMSSLSNRDREKLSKKDLKEKLTHHTGLVYQVLQQSRLENTYSGCYAFNAINLYHPNEAKQKLGEKLFNKTIDQNRNAAPFLFWLTLFTLIFVRRIHIVLLFCMGTTWYITITSSISFWQGDRFNMVLYPLIWFWLILLLSVGIPVLIQLKTRFWGRRINRF